MKFTNLTEQELADNFERVAGDFYTFIRDNGLEGTKVDMFEGGDNRKPELNLCHTPACHGGWAAIMYGDKEYQWHKNFFEIGADRLSKELGFDNDFNLERWAHRNPNYWGNSWGDNMFAYKGAFGKGSGELLHLKDIPDWYMNVAKRLRGESI